MGTANTCSRRHAVLWLAAALSGCAAMRGHALIPIPPTRFGTWTRLSLQSPNVDEAGRPRPTKWIRAAYFHGSLGVQVNAFGYETEAERVEAVASIEHDAEAVSFARPLVLIVCRSQSLDRDALMEFARELEAAWLAPKHSR